MTLLTFSDMKKYAKHWLILLFFLLALLLAGSADYNEAKETERYSIEQTKQTRI